MNLPSKFDIGNAIKYKILIKDPFFDDAELVNRQNGELLSWSGGFSMVFQFKKQNTLWAFKVWDKEIPAMKVRYDFIKQKISRCSLPYFVESEFFEKGMMVNGIFLDTHRMKWVPGLMLHDYLSINVQNRQKMIQLAAKFKEMVKLFHQHKIAHGDLQHRNIIVKNDGNLVVIDYDSMFVEGMLSISDVIKGQAGYQHPARNSNEYSNYKLDYFSELIIYLSLIVYADDPGFWKNGTECLLFEKDDIANPDSCDLLNYLLKSENTLIKTLSFRLLNCLKLNDINLLLPLEDLIESKATKSYPSVTSISRKF